MTIVELRKKQNDLAIRFLMVEAAIEAIFALKFTFPKNRVKACLNAWEDNYRHREGFMYDDPPDYEKLVGQSLDIVSGEFFFPLISDATTASNIVHELNEIRGKAKKGPPSIDGEWLEKIAEPSTDKWLLDEIEVVMASYKRRITAATTILRDINTTWKYLTRHESRLPSFIRPSLLGMFGTSDAQTGFEYSDADFGYQQYGKGPKIMSARWLTPFIGVDDAKTIESSLKTIADASAPLPGEPPTLDGFGSHVSNVIKVFAE